MMKLEQKLIFYFFALLLLASLPIAVPASCPTIQQGPPCLEFWRTDAVFIGIVTRVERTPNNTQLAVGPYLKSTVYFYVEEAFKGVEGTEIVFDLDYCGYLFKEGERYLVYAYRNPNNKKLDVRAGSSRTRLLSEAAEDLEYIRGLPSAEPGSRIFGKVSQSTHNLKESRFDTETLRNIKIILEGNNQRQEVVSDNEGRYEFKGLPAGTYRIRAELPAYLRYDEQTIQLNGRGCVPVDIAALSKGQIAGRVLDIDGKPVMGVAVSLVPADLSLQQILSDKAPTISGFTTQDGSYGFTRLAPGRYLLIINRTDSDKSLGSEISRGLPRLFYPGVNDVGGATVIVVSKDQKPQAYNFHLPIQE